MHRLETTLRGSARPHLHEHHETAIYVLEGRSEMRCGGKESREHVEVRAGQFLFIPAGLPHLPYNPSNRASSEAGCGQLGYRSNKGPPNVVPSVGSRSSGPAPFHR